VRATTGILESLDHGVGDTGDELLLDRRDAQSLDGAAIRIVDRAE
jgi:hypothetical protein